MFVNVIDCVVWCRRRTRL